ncbi:MAG: peptidylprolyl isomerase [Gammaproteobacteria bacterium]
MKITKNAVATIDYTLKDDDGNIIDQSTDGNFAYLHNGLNIIPGLEKALLDKEAGDQVTAVINPEEGYGERDLAQIQRIPREMFPPEADIQVGMQFQGQSPEGQQSVVSVTDIDGDTIVVDGNHPLAGITLNFDVTIIEVREASAEELEHGHVHGPGGHDH